MRARGTGLVLILLTVSLTRALASDEPSPTPQKVTDITDIELGRNIWALEKAYEDLGPSRLPQLRRFLDYPHPLVRLLAARKLAVLRDAEALPRIEKLLASGNEDQLALAKLVIEWTATGDRNPGEVTELAAGFLARRPGFFGEVVPIWCELGWFDYLESIDALREPNRQDHLPFIPEYGDILLRSRLDKVPAPEREAWLFERLVRFEAVWEYEAATRAIIEMGSSMVPRTLSYVEEVISAPPERFGPLGSRGTCLTIGCRLLMSLPTDQRSSAFLEEKKEHFSHRWTKRSRAEALRWLKAGVRYPYRYHRLLLVSPCETMRLTVQDNARTRAWYGKPSAAQAPATEPAAPAIPRPPAAP